MRWGDPHHSQPAVLSLTQATDMGTIYSVADVAALAAVAACTWLRVHIDGARVANSIAALGCTPAELTWRAGVDALSLGATKNGALSAEAIVVFDDSIADELVYRTKRSGHVTSKMRFQSAQLIAYLTDGAVVADGGRCQRPDGAAGGRIGGARRRVRQSSRRQHVVGLGRPGESPAKLESELLFYAMGGRLIRLVTSWQTTAAEIDRTLEVFAAALR